MRTEQIIHQAWFSFGDEPEMTIQLPHTWNALDGQDGGNDYRRGCGRYRLALPRVTNGKRQFVRFEGANHVAEVRCNGRLLGTHKGGFSCILWFKKGPRIGDLYLKKGPDVFIPRCS